MSRIILALICMNLFMTSNAKPFDLTLKRKTSFEKKEHRYPSVLSILEHLKRLAPHLPPLFKDQKEVPEVMICQSVHGDSVNVVGANDPAQIQPLESTPGPLFFPYFEECAKTIVELGFSTPEYAKKNSELILGSPLSKAIGTHNWNTVLFAKLPQELQARIIDRIFLFVVGPEELLIHFNYIGPNTVFLNEIKSQNELRTFLHTNLLDAVPDDSLLGFYTRLATLLRLGPILKN